MGGSYPWGKALWWQLMEWHLWGLIAPVVFWICGRFHRQDRDWSRYIALHTAIGFVASVIQATACTVGGLIELWARGWPLTGIGTPYSFQIALKFTVINHVHVNLMIYGALVIGWHAARHYRELGEREIKSAALEARLAQAQLQALKTQLQPHFLFNTLNAITELIRDDPRAAEQMVLRLAELLRVTLRVGAAQEVSLHQEISFLEKYLEIQRFRLGDRLNVEWDISPETLSARVPNLILQPLVENAIQHGIAPFAKPGRMRIRARRQDGALCLQVRDDGSGASSPGPVASLGPAPGVGLANTRSRLQHLYGAEQRFELLSDNGCVVNLMLPFAQMDPLEVCASERA